MTQTRRTMLAPAAAVAGVTGLVASGSFQAFAVAPTTGQTNLPALRGYTATQTSAYAEGTFCQGALKAAAGASVAAFAIKASSGSRATARSLRVQDRSTVASRVVCAAGGGGAKKRVLVMGGTRFIGCYLVSKLREQGHDVVVVNRGKTNGGLPERLPGASDAEHAKMLEGVTVLKADRKEPEAMKAAITAAGKFDIVFDNNVRKLEEVKPLVEAIEASGGCEQFILMSSAGVYGPTDVLPLTEQNPGDPNSRHKEKLQCEDYLKAKGLNWTSIRPVYIYGPLNYNPVERYFFDRVARGRPVCVPLDGTYITQLGHCEDLADFMTQCIGNPAVNGQVYNVSSEEFVTFDGMAKLCAAAAGLPEPKIVHYDPKSIKGLVPEDWPKAFPFRNMHFFTSIEKAKRDVPGWKPKFTMLEGLTDSYKQDFVARGFDKAEVDFRTDDLILEKNSK
ncbi:unnamed protein product [Polarella glacialis]|uniref:NAD-dependent epimerase/dehydratase domain-containing protein n=1 Tax=Polarella glacialis TaxID=89957 RepID=A0A813FC47_POLGL|nr:unnamed protein product [Polarella glacialis]CAE8610375.1 unnamed protein product [Polarella glacialis]CAE8681685.1 unnamed protein product [Polarella glacialis]CAE8681687.1 unnamed protein product [Polarella glacialis]